MKKKITAVVLACAMAVSMGMAASAADVNANQGTGDVALEGNITYNPELISVAMPANINFEVGLKKTGEDMGKFDKVISGAGNITNNSNCDVNIRLAKVVDDKGFSALNKMDLFMEKADTTDLTGKTALAEGSPDRDMGNVLANGGVMSLKVFGQANAADAKLLDDSVKEQKFSVTLTLKVVKVTEDAPVA